MATPAASPAELLATLTPAMCRALWRCQRSLFHDPPNVSGHGMTMRALRHRGLVLGAMPHAHLTPLGWEVMRLVAPPSSESSSDTASL